MQVEGKTLIISIGTGIVKEPHHISGKQLENSLNAINAKLDVQNTIELLRKIEMKYPNLHPISRKTLVEFEKRVNELARLKRDKESKSEER